MSKKKIIDFKDTYKFVKEYAEKHCEGNFSMAVRKLIIKGVNNAKLNDNKAD